MTAVKGFVAGVAASVAATVLANVMFTGVRWPSVADHFYAPRGKVMRVVGAAADVETARDKGQLSGTCKNTAAVAVVLDQDTAGKRQRFVLGAADCVGGKVGARLSNDRQRWRDRHLVASGLGYGAADAQWVW